ncbi:MAG: sulfite oxidase heme-binding subunit YedZ [Alphaproteobacteria bacterium]
MFPWHDPRGAISPLKTAAFAALFLPAAAVAILWATDGLGARPLDAAIDLVGQWTIRLLFVTLAITPLAALLKWPRVILLRRMAGVATFCYAILHLLLFAADKGWLPGVVAGEIVLRVYLTIGFAGLLVFAALAATSTDAAMRRLGARRWRRLHALVYPAAVLAVVHHFLQAKLAAGEPLVMAGLLAWLLAFRALARGYGSAGRIPPRVAALSLVLAAPLTALGEAVWYAPSVGADPLLLLAANLSAEAGTRPAWVVAAFVVPLAVATLLRARRPAAARLRPAAA